MHKGITGWRDVVGGLDWRLWKPGRCAEPQPSSATTAARGILKAGASLNHGQSGLQSVSDSLFLTLVRLKVVTCCVIIVDLNLMLIDRKSVV